MKIGFLRYDKNPTRRARCLFALSSLYEVEFFYFRPECVDMQNKKIKGIFCEKGIYVERETSYPDIIDDIYSFQFKHKNIYKHLSEYCTFTYTRLGGKSKVNDILKKSKENEHYLIETYEYKHNNIDDILEKHKQVIIKPTNGNKGNNVYKLYKEDNLYVLQLKEEIHKLSQEDYNKKYFDTFSNAYLIQRYVCSKTNAGNPFDIRIDIRRGKNGNWKLLKLLPRIGNINVVVSNISQGGSISEIQDFLPNEFGDDWKEIYDKLILVSRNLPQLIQKNYSKLIDALGFDVGIDRENNNELKIFEVNTFPWSNAFDFEVAETSIQYYFYLYEIIKK